MSSLGRKVIQGFFAGNRPRIVAQPYRPGVAQALVRGPATQLPPGLLNFRSHGIAQRLPEALQRKMREIFKADFSDVRVHVGNEAASIGAQAFTCGSNLYFAHGQYNPTSVHGQRLIAHELTHVVQQREGRVRNPFGGGIALVQDLSLEVEAERFALRVGHTLPAVVALTPAHRPPQPVQPKTRPTGPTTMRRPTPIQAKWRTTPLNPDYYEWDKVINGVRWYRHKRDDYELYYFMVEQPTESNRRMVPNQGYELRRGDFSVSGMDEPPGDSEFGDAIVSVDDQPQDYTPFLFKPVKHVAPKGYWEPVTAFRSGNNQKKFENNGIAKPGKAQQGGTKPGLKDDANVGKYVFHLTTLRNLVCAPNTTTMGTGIISNGLDPSKGGGRGGACETCRVLDDKIMLEESQKNSKGVVAVTTALSNFKMYANQRYEDTLRQFAEGKLSANELVFLESILLRFKLKQEHINAMEVDPQHPKDDYVRLIKNILIKPQEIEALTSDGWKPLAKLENIQALGNLQGELPPPGTYDANDLSPGQLLAIVNAGLKRNRRWAVEGVERARGNEDQILKDLYAYNVRFRITVDGEAYMLLRGG